MPINHGRHGTHRKRSGKAWGVTTAVANAKMTKRQKLALAERLLADTGVHDKPSYLHSSDDPALDAVLKRRLNDRSSGAWLSLDEFRARTMASNRGMQAC